MKILFTSKLTIFLLSIILSLSIMLGFSISAIMSMEKPVTIIDFTSMTQDEVLLWASTNEIVIETVEAFDEESAIGTILTQTIQKDERLFAGQKITITVSKGPDPEVLVNIEDLVGKDIGEVQTFIDKSKLMNAHILFEKSEDIDMSFLISQSVVNQEIKRSDEINFVISTGTRDSITTVIVPDFTTYTKTQASTWGSDNNITINFIEEFNSSIEQNMIFEQSQVASSEIYDGSSITLKISKGAGVVLDNLVGKSKSDIDRIMIDNHLKVSYTYTYSSTQAENVGLSMNPSASTRVQVGSTVTVSLSLGKVALTNFTGRTLVELENWIKEVNSEGANLKINSSIAYSDSVSSGNIISQSPSTGDINPGTSITVSVSKGGGVTVKTFTSRTDTQEGLTVSIIEKYSTSTSGTVISQSIASGTRVDSGTTISLTVSIGQVPVTSKIGGTLTDLQSWVNTVNAKGAGLTISSSESYTSNQADKGKITSQSPSSGSINPGSTITAVVSKGTQITINNYVGSSTPSNFTGVTFTVIGQEFNSATSGTVLWQSKSAGTYDYGITVELKTSKGPEPSIVLPDLAGLVGGSTSFATSKSTIENYLNSKGLTNYSISSCECGIGAGLVNSQSPAGGTSVTSSSAISVQISTN